MGLRHRPWPTPFAQPTSAHDVVGEAVYGQRVELNAEIPPGVLDDVLANPSRLLDAAAKAEPGWSEEFGGPPGVAKLAHELRLHLRAQAARAGDIRAAAQTKLHRERWTFAAIGSYLGVTAQAVKESTNRAAKQEPGDPLLDRLIAEDTW